MSELCIHTDPYDLDFLKTLNLQSLDMKNIEIKRRQSKHLTTHIQMFEGLSAEKRQAAAYDWQAELCEDNKNKKQKIPWFPIQYKEEFSNG